MRDRGDQTGREKEIEHNLSVITDGEFSKSMWHLDFVWGFDGAQRYIADHGYFFRDVDGTSKYETRKDIGLRITGKLSGKNHHFIKLFEQSQETAGDQQTKLCVPSPSHIYGELSWSDNIGGTDAVYQNKQELKAGLVKAYKEFVAEFAAAGGKILQFDDCLWELFADDNPNSPFTGEHINQAEVQGLATEFIEINNTVIDFGHSLGLKMWTHNCRGNYDSRNMGGGSYAKIANLFLKQLKYDRFFLEMMIVRVRSKHWRFSRTDRKRRLSWACCLPKPIRLMMKHASSVCLTKHPKSLIRIACRSHQCGFASCDGGNELSEAEQWAKIDQGQQIAKQYWNN